METVHSLEKTIGAWYKDVPHLPKGLTTWLVNNAWWIVVIGVVLSVFSLFVVIPSVLFVLGLSTGVSGMLGYALVNADLGAANWIIMFIGIVSLIIVTILEAMAINPLKSKLKKGWELLFVATLVNFAFSILQGLVAVDIVGIFFTALWSAVGIYVLFEVRSGFVQSHTAAKKK